MDSSSLSLSSCIEPASQFNLIKRQQHYTHALLNEAEVALILASAFGSGNPVSKQEKRDRSWSLDSLETLCCVASREVKSDSKHDPCFNRPSSSTFGSTEEAAIDVTNLPSAAPVSESSMPLASFLFACPELLTPSQLASYNRNGRIGIYTPEQRKQILARYHRKRHNRVWGKRIRYVCRKALADQRQRVGGRFVAAAAHRKRSQRYAEE